MWHERTRWKHLMAFKAHMSDRKWSDWLLKIMFSNSQGGILFTNLVFNIISYPYTHIKTSDALENCIHKVLLRFHTF